MTLTLPKLRGRVQSRLKDKDGRMDNPSSVDIDMALADAYLDMQADLPAFTLYTAAAFTIPAGSDLFTLPVSVSGSGYGTGTVEYAGQVRIQLVSNGLFLDRRTLEELNSFRDGQPTLLTGFPHLFALYEDNTQVIRGRCYPGAKATESCNLFATLTADDLRDYIGSGSSGMDDVSVNMSRWGAGALVARTASLLLKRMDETAVKTRGLNPSIADAWWAESERLIYEEAARRNALESNGRTQRWVP